MICPIKKTALAFPNETAIILDNEIISYQKLDRAIDKIKPEAIFYAPTTLKTILLILSNLRHKRPCYPINPRQPKLPNLKDLPPHLLIQTSGTSKEPKVAILTKEALMMNAMHNHEDFVLEPGKRWGLSLPLYHIGGIAILYRCFLKGAAVVLSQSKVDYLSLVPVQLRRLLDNPKPLRPKILLGGQQIPLSLCKEAQEQGYTVYPTYGMTEMGSQIATMRFNNEICFGEPLPKRIVEIVDGEIWVGGDTLFSGYVGKKPPKGLHPTGDLGDFGPEGLIIKGRKDRQFISGGENIQPEVIEKLLLLMPEITSAKVEPEKDMTYGQRPVGYISRSSPLPIEEIKRRLLEQLPKFMVPQVFYKK